jgi:hybrid cluster-associated redox disulfide protein
MINKTMTIGDIVEKCPEAVPIMMAHGLHCIGCHVASWESLEEGCRGHGMNEEMIDSMVSEINEKVSK